MKPEHTDQQLVIVRNSFILLQLMNGDYIKHNQKKENLVNSMGVTPKLILVGVQRTAEADLLRAELACMHPRRACLTFLHSQT